MSKAILCPLTVVLLLGGCATWPQRPLSDAELTAVRAAQAFVCRHGLTAAGHPADLPVERIELFDGMYNDQALREHRKGMLEASAFGVAHPTEDNSTDYYVHFRVRSHAQSYRDILVVDGVAVRLSHGNPGPEYASSTNFARHGQSSPAPACKG